MIGFVLCLLLWKKIIYMRFLFPCFFLTRVCVCVLNSSSLVWLFLFLLFREQSKMSPPPPSPQQPLMSSPFPDGERKSSSGDNLLDPFCKKCHWDPFNAPSHFGSRVQFRGSLLVGLGLPFWMTFVRASRLSLLVGLGLPFWMTFVRASHLSRSLSIF